METSTEKLVFLLARGLFLYDVFCGVYTPVGFVITGSRFGIAKLQRSEGRLGIRQKMGGLPSVCLQVNKFLSYTYVQICVQKRSSPGSNNSGYN